MGMTVSGWTRRLSLALLMVLVVSLVAGCGGSDDNHETPTATATTEVAESASATATEAPPTPTDEVIPEPTSTATEEPEPTEPSPTEEPEPTATSEPTEEPTAEPEPTVDPNPFPEAVESLLGTPNGFYGVFIEAVDGSFSYELNADEQVESASLYKLPIMVELFRQREAGELDFSSSVYMDPAYFGEAGGDVYGTDYIGSYVVIDDLIFNMITLSSNVAAYALLDLAGHENINATMQNIGLYNTEIRWEPATSVAAASGSFNWEKATQHADESLNVTTARDMGELFRMISEGSLISPEASQEMFDILAQQAINDRIPALLPPDVVVAHKTGNLPGEVVHDAGIIEAPRTPVIVVVVTEFADEGVAYDFMQQVSLLAYARAS